MSRFFLLLMIGFACVLLSGCICPYFEAVDNGGNNYSNMDTGTSGDSTIVIVDSGGSTNNGGMSDPSKCRNLPPQQMADCLEQSMGG